MKNDWNDLPQITRLQSVLFMIKQYIALILGWVSFQKVTYISSLLQLSPPGLSSNHSFCNVPAVRCQHGSGGILVSAFIQDIGEERTERQLALNTKQKCLSAIDLIPSVMGASMSTSEILQQHDLAMVRVAFPQTVHPIDWADANSVTGHSVVNTMENAAYHNRSGKKGKGAHRRAAAQLSCLGAFSSCRQVQFVSLAEDIPRVIIAGFLPGIERVATGLPNKIISSGNSCGSLSRAASSDSFCSLDDTVKRPTSDHAHCPAHCDDMKEHMAAPARPFVDAFSAHHCPVDGCIKPYSAAAHLDAHSNLLDFDICQILTCGGSSRTPKPVDICDILTSGGRGCCPSPVEFQGDCYRASEICLWFETLQICVVL